MPRSAFLEGAREAGGTKTCTGAIARQKTAVPQGAASLSLAVLESDRREREVAEVARECAGQNHTEQVSLWAHLYLRSIQGLPNEPQT